MSEFHELTVRVDLTIKGSFDEKSWATVQKVAEREDVTPEGAYGIIIERHRDKLRQAFGDAVVAEARDLAAAGDPPFEDAGSFFNMARVSR